MEQAAVRCDNQSVREHGTAFQSVREHGTAFSAYAGEAIPPQEPESLERLARYMTRAPVALSKVFPQKSTGEEFTSPLGHAGRRLSANAKW